MKSMKHTKLNAEFVAVIFAGLFVSGCSHDPNILDQQAAAKKLPPPTAAQLQKGFAEMSANHDKAKQDEIDWAKAHPDKVAAVNAARAQSGKPPLGQ